MALKRMYMAPRIQSATPKTKTENTHLPPALNRRETLCVLSPRKKRRIKTRSKYETVAMDVSPGRGRWPAQRQAQGNDKGKRAKTRICVTSLTKLVCNVVARCLLESRELLSFSVFPAMQRS